jgi:hypothetical protein
MSDPGSTRSMATDRSPAASRTSTSLGASSISRPMALRARSRLCASSHCAAANSVTTMAASSYSPMIIAPITAITIRTLMSSDKRRIDCHARCAGNTEPTTVAAISRPSTHHAGSTNRPMPQPVIANAAAIAVNHPRTRAPVAGGSLWLQQASLIWPSRGASRRSGWPRTRKTLRRAAVSA